MSLATAADIPIQIIVPNDASQDNSRPLLSAERRITPSWTISQLKSKLEPVTGIPSFSQTIRTRALDGSWLVFDDEESLVGDRKWGLRKGSEIEVIDTRPAAARQNFTDVSAVEKYEMPETQYEQLTDSVLAWKRRQKLGRFDPNAKSATELAEEKSIKDEKEVRSRGIKTGERCRVGTDDGRRGVVRYVGFIEGLGGERERGCIWVGIELDEPVGKNDGSVKVDGEGGQQETRRVFECQDKFGVFARPEKVEVGDWPALDDLDIDEDMEEI